MQFLKKIKGWVSQPVAESKTPLPEFWLDDLVGNNITGDKALKVPTFYACVKIMRSAVTSMPLIIKQKKGTGNEELESHAVAKLFRGGMAWAGKGPRPQTPGTMKEMIIAGLILDGNAYVQINRLGSKIVGLQVIPASNIAVEFTADGTPKYTMTTVTGQSVTRGPKDIMHIIINSDDGVKGRSILDDAGPILNLAQTYLQFAKEITSNRPEISGVLETPVGLSQSAIDHIKKSLLEYSKGAHRHKILLLEEGAKLSRPTHNSNDLQLIQMQKQIAAEIATMFLIPPHMVGHVEKSTSWGTGIEQQSQGFLRFSLQYYLSAIEEAINCNLLSVDNGEYAVFDKSALLKADLPGRFAAYSTGINAGVLTPNEAREKEQLSPLDGGEQLLLPANLLPAGGTDGRKSDA